jgi:hypothetical protein
MLGTFRLRTFRLRTFRAARPPIAASLLLAAALLGLAAAPSHAQSVPARAQSDNAAKPARPDPYDALRNARTIFIRSKSVYFKPQSLEQALVNRDEFQDWELVVTRDEADADLVVEVARKLFTNRFVYNVIDPRANRVLMGGRIGSLGGTVEGQIADSFIKKLRRVRAGGRPAGSE